MYKLISKYLGNILKGFMDEFISECQSAFMRGRLIHDNVIVGFEGIHTMRKNIFRMVKKWLSN